jgi:hypothetical protein
MERSSGGLWAESHNGAEESGIPLQLDSTPREPCAAVPDRTSTVHLVMSLLLLLFLLLVLLLQ